MSKEIFTEFFRLVDQRFFLLLYKLAANRAEWVNHAEINRIRLLIKAFCQNHIDLVLAHVDREGFEVIGVGIGVVG